MTLIHDDNYLEVTESARNGIFQDIVSALTLSRQSNDIINHWVIYRGTAEWFDNDTLSFDNDTLSFDNLFQDMRVNDRGGKTTYPLFNIRFQLVLQSPVSETNY